MLVIEVANFHHCLLSSAGNLFSVNNAYMTGGTSKWKTENGVAQNLADCMAKLQIFLASGKSCPVMIAGSEIGLALILVRVYLRMIRSLRFVAKLAESLSLSLDELDARLS
jgi:hypothetical protein